MLWADSVRSDSKCSSASMVSLSQSPCLTPPLIKRRQSKASLLQANQLAMVHSTQYCWALDPTPGISDYIAACSRLYWPPYLLVNTNNLRPVIKVAVSDTSAGNILKFPLKPGPGRNCPTVTAQISCIAVRTSEPLLSTMESFSESTSCPIMTLKHACSGIPAPSEQGPSDLL